MQQTQRTSSTCRSGQAFGDGYIAALGDPQVFNTILTFRPSTRLGALRGPAQDGDEEGVVRPPARTTSNAAGLLQRNVLQV